MTKCRFRVGSSERAAACLGQQLLGELRRAGEARQGGCPQGDGEVPAADGAAAAGGQGPAPGVRRQGPGPPHADDPHQRLLAGRRPRPRRRQRRVPAGQRRAARRRVQLGGQAALHDELGDPRPGGSQRRRDRAADSSSGGGGRGRPVSAVRRFLRHRAARPRHRRPSAGCGAHGHRRGTASGLPDSAAGGPVRGAGIPCRRVHTGGRLPGSRHCAPSGRRRAGPRREPGDGPRQHHQPHHPGHRAGRARRHSGEAVRGLAGLPAPLTAARRLPRLLLGAGPGDRRPRHGQDRGGAAPRQAPAGPVPRQPCPAHHIHRRPGFQPPGEPVAAARRRSRTCWTGSTSPP